MKRKILLLLVCIFASMQLYADHCPKCKGSGRFVVFPQVSNYGARETRKLCPICRQYVYSGHTEQCDLCGGTGQRNRRVSRSETLAQQSTDGLWAYLTPDEYATVMSLFESLKGHPETQNCLSCQGSGRCKLCGGYVNFDPDITPCLACSGTGKCGACYGSGTGQTVWVEPSNKDQIVANIKLFTDRARARMNAETQNIDVEEWGGNFDSEDSAREAAFIHKAEKPTTRYAKTKTTSTPKVKKKVQKLSKMDKIRLIVKNGGRKLRDNWWIILFSCFVAWIIYKVIDEL